MKTNDYDKETYRNINRLHEAIKNNRVDKVQQLINNGYDVKMANSKGHTALFHAAVNNNVTIAEMLIAAGADINAQTRTNGHTALHVAALNCNREVARYLLKKGAKDIENKAGLTALELAVLTGQEQGQQPKYLNFVKMMLLNDNVGNRTPLHAAAATGKENVVKFLFDNDAALDTLNRKDASNNTPLALAAWKGHDKVVELLLKKGADLNIKDSWNCTPLYLAADEGHFKVVQLLLEKKANPNAKGINGRGPLHKAVGKGYLEIAKLLLENGANPNQEDISGETPFCIAEINDDLNAVLLILEKGNISKLKDIPKGLLSWAAGEGHLELVTCLLEKGVSPDQKNTIGTTSLYTAIYKGHFQIAELLLGKGADINMKNESGHTPLSSAAIYNNLKIAKWLLDRGANPNTPDNSGTPLSWAVGKGHSELVTLLLEKGADIDIEYFKSISPITYAFNTGYFPLIKLMLTKFSDSVVNDKDILGQTLSYIDSSPENLPNIIETIQKALKPKDTNLDYTAESFKEHLRLAYDDNNPESTIIGQVPNDAE